MDQDLSRRAFLGGLAAGAAALAAGEWPASAEEAPAEELPKVDRRTLGRSGMEVPILGCGLATFFTEAYGRQREAAHEALRYAIKLGAGYFDTANAYGPSQEIIAPVVREQRKDIFLVSKSAKRSAEAFRRELHHTLDLFQTDHLDLFHVHGLLPGEDLDSIERGAVRAARRAKEEGLIRAWGITGHKSAGILAEAIRAWDPDCVQTVLCADRRDDGRFEDEVLPLAREHKMGILAMKTVCFVTHAGLKVPDMVRYALTLDGVACAVVGLQDTFQLLQNAWHCSGFQPLRRPEQAALSDAVRLARGEAPPPWERPGYQDGVPEPEHFEELRRSRAARQA